MGVWDVVKSWKNVDPEILRVLSEFRCVSHLEESFKLVLCADCLSLKQVLGAASAQSLIMGSVFPGAALLCHMRLHANMHFE